MGYGVTSATLLVSFGIAPAIASASVHTAEVFVDAFSAFSHLRMGNVKKDALTPLLIPGIVGAVLGAYGLAILPTEIVKPLVGFALLCMGCLILCRHAFKRGNEPTPNKKHSKKALALLGFVAALIDVSGGGGWGPICTPTFILTGSNPREAVGTVEFTEPIISLVAVVTFALTIGLEKFLFTMIVPLLIGGLALTPIAAYICKKMPHRILGTLIGLWIMILNVRTLLLAAGII